MIGIIKDFENLELKETRLKTGVVYHEDMILHRIDKNL